MTSQRQRRRFAVATSTGLRRSASMVIHPFQRCQSAAAFGKVGGSINGHDFGDHPLIPLFETVAVEAAEFVAAERILEVVHQAFVAIGAFLARLRPVGLRRIFGRSLLAISGRAMVTPSQAFDRIAPAILSACWKPPVQSTLTLGSIAATARGNRTGVVEVDPLDHLSPPQAPISVGRQPRAERIGEDPRS